MTKILIDEITEINIKFPDEMNLTQAVAILKRIVAMTKSCETGFNAMTTKTISTVKNVNGKNYRTLFTEEQERQIIVLANAGQKAGEIAKSFPNNTKQQIYGKVYALKKAGAIK